MKTQISMGDAKVYRMVENNFNFPPDASMIELLIGYDVTANLEKLESMKVLSFANGGWSVATTPEQKQFVIDHPELVTY